MNQNQSCSFFTIASSAKINYLIALYSPKFIQLSYNEF